MRICRASGHITIEEKEDVLEWNTYFAGGDRVAYSSSDISNAEREIHLYSHIKVCERSAEAHEGKRADSVKRSNWIPYSNCWWNGGSGKKRSDSSRPEARKYTHRFQRRPQDMRFWSLQTPNYSQHAEQYLYWDSSLSFPWNGYFSALHK